MTKEIKKKRRIHRSLYLLLIISLSITLLGGCKKQKGTVPELMDPTEVKLDTETVIRDTIYDIDMYEGSVVPYTEGIYFNEDSKIGAVLAGVGDYVEKGQTLLALDRTSWQEEVDKLNEEIALAEELNKLTNEQLGCDIEIAVLQLETLKVAGTEEQIALKNIEIETMEEQLNYAVQLQELELNKKKERLASLENNLAQNDLVAPFSGTVIYCANLHEGSTAAAYDPLIYLADDSRKTVQTNYLSADILSDSQSYYALLGDKQYEITNVPYSEDEYKYRVYNKLSLKSNFALNEPDDNFECGNYVALCFVRNYMENVLVMPKKALYRDGSTRYVYKIIDGERVRTEVEVGNTTRIMAEITNGLSEGDEVYVQQ